jgi:CheY-like chemotaxis protein
MTTILIIEDELLLAECYTRWLAAESYTVYHATGAQAALDVLDEQSVHVVLLDMLLPGANGMQVLNTLQSHADLAGIPVIICSNALPQKHPDFSAYGVKAVLDKSVLTREKLRIAVAEALST